MSQPLIEDAPDVHHLTTEDDTAVDNLPSEKHQRLLTEPLYSSWIGPGENRPFLAAANVGVFYLAHGPAIVPDVFLSLDVEVAADWWQKEHRSYFVWEFGKPPEVVIEIVSNTVGGEDGEKRKKYARMRVGYYVIYDPQRQVMSEPLTVYHLQGFEYEKQTDAQFPALRLGLTLWDGVFEGKESTWLRWTDEHGRIIPTGKERAEQERERAQQERERAEQAEHRESAQRQRAEQAEQLLTQERDRLERLAELLRQLGKDPDQV
ncbi:MAG: Uma2 family endonuclease [Acidobacteriota bacterium]|nr:Uma2 family endonuclease [Acidobacteriota bacterium]